MTDESGSTDPKRDAFESGWARAMAMPAPPPLPEGSFGAFASDIAFGSLWNRGQLTTRERRLVILTVLAMFGRDDITRMHMGSALDLGDLTADDLNEIAVTLATYAGFPVGVAFNGLATKLVAERGSGSADA
jgi:alkylhydroperoxidase/carboxymuconolactone decarboxylase family protein YurZ